MNKQKIYLLALILLIAMACKKDNQKEHTQKIVIQWIGKTIIFPSDIPSYSIKGDTISSNITPYKVLVFTDSTGCTSCKLHLYKWNTLIEEADSLMSDKLSFQFYFHPQDEKELKFLLKRDNFTHPIFLDLENKMDKANQFPNEMNFQTFLLDQNNKVLLIGNPTLNPTIWDLYRQTVNGHKSTKGKEAKAITTIEVNQYEIELDNLQVGKTATATFVMKNTGNKPFLITDVTAACGCTVPKWNKKPIMPNEQSEITVAITPDTKGYFNKTVSVFCNVENKRIKLSIKGMTKE